MSAQPNPVAQAPASAPAAEHQHRVIIDDEKHDGRIDEEEDDTLHDTASSHNSIQAGVKGIEAISKVWTVKSLFVAYVGLLLMAFATSLEGQVVGTVLPFVTSDFKVHSLIPTIAVVTSVVLAVGKPPMAKIADVFGRIEAFSLSILLYVLGYIIMATSKNVQTYAAAQIFYALGSTGLFILQQIFIADTTDLSWRALMSTLPDIPFLITTWIGAPIGVGIMKSSGSWRWAIAMWAIILPVCFLPLFISLFLNGRRAKRLGLAPKTSLFVKVDSAGGSKVLAQAKSIGATFGKLSKELDLGGILLLSAGFAMVLIPCTIAAGAAGGWSNKSIIAMLTIGAILLVIYPFWEMSTYVGKKYQVQGTLGRVLREMAPYPLTPLYLLKSRTFTAGCVLITFYFMAFNLSVFPYFYSYLLVVRNMQAQNAVYVVQIFSFTATVSSLIVSVLIKLTHRYKWFILFGSGLYMLGMGLMMYYRTQSAPLPAVIGAQILIGFGGGFLNVPAQLGVQASAGHQNLGSATAIFLTLISIGSAIGQAISGAVWSRNIPRKLALYLPPEAQVNGTLIYGSIVVAMEYPMGSPARDAIIRSYQETMQILVTIAVCTVAPVIICAVLMRDYHLDEMEQGVLGRVIGGNVGKDRRRKDMGMEGTSPYNPKGWVANFQSWNAERKARANGVVAQDEVR